MDTKRYDLLIKRIDSIVDKETTKIESVPIEFKDVPITPAILLKIKRKLRGIFKR